MLTVIHILSLLIALEHFLFLILEMFLWTKPLGRKVFGQTKSKAETTALLAANQGLYNGFLASGLLWGVFNSNKVFGKEVITFFLVCIVVAGVYGGLTASKKIIYLQAVPAIVVLCIILFG